MLKEFLVKLSTDDATLESFKKDPKKTINNAHLSDEEKQAVLTGNVKKIRQLLGKNAFATAGEDLIIVVIIVAAAGE